MTTINISLPTSLYRDIKKTIKERGYSSVSEMVRDAVRRVLYPEITENGFTPEFEEMVLESAKEPIDESKIWETEEDINKYFAILHKKLEKLRHVKG